MKIIRFLSEKGQIHHGIQELDGAVSLLEGDLYGHYTKGARIKPVKILAPLVPLQILCVGLNYKRHAVESHLPLPAWPVLFVKGINALQNPGDPIEIPSHLKSEQVDYECELAVVIGKKCKNVGRKQALDYVLGYTCANDVSARDWQIQYGGGQWCRGKFFDTFAPLGPCLVTADEITDPNSLRIQTRLNDQSVQDWNTRDMIFDVPQLIEFLSGSTTLLPGTVILTGTPHGVGMAHKPPLWLKEGDHVEIEIEGIGTLSNPVVAERNSSH